MIVERLVQYFYSMRMLLLLTLLAPSAALAQARTQDPARADRPTTTSKTGKVDRAETARPPAPRATGRCADGQDCARIPVNTTGEVGTSSDTPSDTGSSSWSNDSTGANTTVGDGQGQPSSGSITGP